MKREGSRILDIEAFVKKEYESLKVQVEAKEKLIMEPKPRQMVIKEEETVEYQCIMDIFTLSSLIAQVRAICVNSIKGSCPK